MIEVLAELVEGREREHAELGDRREELRDVGERGVELGVARGALFLEAVLQAIELLPGDVDGGAQL